MKSAIHLEPENALFQTGLGRMYLRLSRYVEATKVFRKSTRLDSTSAPAWNGLGQALAGSGEYAEAETHLQHALRLNPAYPEAHYNLSSVFLRQGKIEEG
ncbi:MAG TPA: tetratricopeptide repeat protein, partial [Candidatus Handelsmanbacteria bacterium]|nr:tetratricopeptide repeat protein [Candidatus Handelsmanbacteria bacterium]